MLYHGMEHCVGRGVVLVGEARLFLPPGLEREIQTLENLLGIEFVIIGQGRVALSAEEMEKVRVA